MFDEIIFLIAMDTAKGEGEAEQSNDLYLSLYESASGV